MAIILSVWRTGGGRTSVERSTCRGETRYRPGGGETICPPPMAVRRWLAYLFTANRAIVDQKIVADLRPSADGSAVRTSLVAGGS